MYLLKLTFEGFSKNKFSLCREDFSITLIFCGDLRIKRLSNDWKISKRMSGKLQNKDLYMIHELTIHEIILSYFLVKDVPALLAQ